MFSLSLDQDNILSCCVFNNTFLNIEILSPLQVNGTSATCQVDNVISQVTDIQLGKVYH